MLINKNIKIIGKKCVLVPYRREHVRKYHHWMQSEELRRLTASEPLTLEEEFEMQNSWMNDADKCTFIVLDKGMYQATKDEVGSMIGDTNLFFANADDRLCAEAEIMIAEEWGRNKKCGSEAMQLMFLYGILHLGVKQFIVKITMDNEISLCMFMKFGFVETSRAQVFNEVTLSRIVDEEWIENLKRTLTPFEVVDENIQL